MEDTAISIRRWLLNRLGIGRNLQISCAELFEAAEEVRIRELAFHICVNLIANAVGKCEFKTFLRHQEIRKQEYYLWNFEPNINQSSTIFLHKLIYRLYSDNEALIIPTKRRDGTEMLAVADSFVSPLEYPARMQEYSGVVVGEVSYNKTFKENEVMHFKLNHSNIKPVLDGLYQSYYKLVAAAMKNYTWGTGKHYKVHVGQIAQGQEDWEKNFRQVIEEQIKPFLQAENAVLPEFDGYQYEDVGGKPDTQRSTRDIRSLLDDVFAFTANAFCIPPVLLLGDVAGTADAMERWLTTCIDPLCDQIQEEIIRKRYGYQEWQKGNYLKIDTSAILHFDLFANATNIEKLIGSGAFSINDIRRAAGQSEIGEDWARRHFLTLNISTIENAAKAIDGEGGE